MRQDSTGEKDKILEYIKLGILIGHPYSVHLLKSPKSLGGMS